MSNEVGEYGLVSQAWTLHNSALHAFLQKIVDAMATKRLSAGVGEGHGRVTLVQFQFLEPGPKHSGSCGPQRGTARSFRPLEHTINYS